MQTKQCISQKELLLPKKTSPKIVNPDESLRKGVRMVKFHSDISL